ncbi:MAG: hypothetical protein M3P18_16540 [Actinomycetota bacterium]|nr:hypothetical protein [Actinomycetota bacterium]
MKSVKGVQLVAGCSHLGAWPWAEELLLPRAWWTDAPYLGALASWHREAWLAAYSSLLWRAAQFMGCPRTFGTVDGWIRARAAYEFEIRSAASQQNAAA